MIFAQSNPSTSQHKNQVKLVQSSRNQSQVYSLDKTQKAYNSNNSAIQGNLIAPVSVQPNTQKMAQTGGLQSKR